MNVTGECKDFIEQVKPFCVQTTCFFVHAVMVITKRDTPAKRLYHVIQGTVDACFEWALACEGFGS